jgi:phage head maturation protease
MPVLSHLQGRIQKSLDADQKTYTAVLWDGSEADRHGETIDVSRFDWSHYEANPIVLAHHDSDLPVGRCTRIWTEGTQMLADFVLSATAKGQEIATLIAEGVLSAVSVGFYGHDDGSCELAEFSIVSIPAHRSALITGKSAEPESSNPQPLGSTTMNQEDLMPVIQASTPSLSQQLKSALPDLLKGGSFKTEVSRKAAAHPVSGFDTDVAGAIKLTLPAQFEGFYSPGFAKNRLVHFVDRRTVDAQSVEFVRLSLPHANAAKVKELALKPEGQLAALSVNLPMETFAVWIEASKQILADAAGLDAAISNLLIEDVARAVDVELYEAMTAKVGDFMPFTPTSNVAADSTLEASMAVIQAGGTDVVTAVNPADYFKIATAKASTSGVYLNLPMGAPQVIACPSVAAGKILSFCRTAVVMFERDPLGIFVGYHGDQFVRNAVTILCEARGAAAVIDPTRVHFGNLVKA